MAYQVGAWINGRQVGEDGSLGAPGVFNLGNRKGSDAPVQNSADQEYINQQRINPTPPSIPQQYTNPVSNNNSAQNPFAEGNGTYDSVGNLLKQPGGVNITPGMPGLSIPNKTGAIMGASNTSQPNFAQSMDVIPGVATPSANSSATPSANVPVANGIAPLPGKQGERTNEVPMDSMDRTHVSKGTPSWVVPILQKVSRKYNIPTSILSAVAKQESGFIANRVQPDGLGRGMFQLDLGQHADVTEDEAFDPNFAADYAAKLLREGFDRTGTWAGALRYYNGGGGYNSNRPGYQGRPVAELTQDYANSVLGFSQDTIPVQDIEFVKKQLASQGK